MSNIATSIRSNTAWCPVSAIGRIRRFTAMFGRNCFRRIGPAILRPKVASASGAKDGAMRCAYCALRSGRFGSFASAALAAPVGLTCSGFQQGMRLRQA
jgi:hypothetical protein